MSERWTDESLDRFAAMVAESHQKSDERLTRIEESIATSHERLTHIEQAQTTAAKERQELREIFMTTIQVIADSNQRHEAENESFKQRQDATLQAIHAMQTQIIEIQTDVREMQSEVRGLQVENRRIMDNLFGSES